MGFVIKGKQKDFRLGIDGRGIEIDEGRKVIKE